jgi:protease-4
MKAFFTAIAANLVTIALCVVGGILLIIGIAAAAGGDKPVTVRHGSVLLLDLDQTFVDAPTAAEHHSVLDDALLAGGKNTLPLRSAMIALRAAAGDEDISSVLIRGSINASGYGSGYAALRELRTAIADFRKSKKPVHAYLVNPETRDYYIASAASSITLDPFGSLLMPGMASEQVFFAGLLEKFGVGVQVSRVGRFKAAVEPYTRKDMSPENRLQTKTYLGEMWSEVKRGIAESRGIDTTALQTLVDAQGIILPADAKQAHLIDRVAYFDEVLADLEMLAGVRPSNRSDTGVVAKVAEGESDVSALLAQPTLPQVTLEAYAPIAAARARVLGAKQNIGIVYAEGDIVDGQGGSGSIGGDGLARELRRVRSDASVKAIVLRINSPGGSAIASEKIQRELMLLRRTKPIVVSMGTVAASGGYWIATAASRVFAQPNTITGSIGVFSLVPNIKGLAEKNGVTFDTVKTGRYADLFTLSRPRTADELAVLQRGTDAVYAAFIDRVSKARTLSPDSVRAIAEGRVWSGTDAMRIGLVDSIGGLDAAVKSAAALAKLTGDYDIREYPRSKSTAELLTEMFERKPAPVAALANANAYADAMTGRGPVQRLSREVLRQVGVLLAFDDERGVYARLPFVLNVR